MKPNFNHLSLAAGRVFGSEAAARIEIIFQFSLEIGGLTELEFEREPGASYNPRPARVALILINDLSIADPTTVGAGVLAAVLPADPGDPLLVKIEAAASCFSNGPAVLALAQAARLPLDRIDALEQPARAGAAAIAAAIFLDRMRHFHMTPAWKETGDKSRWLEQVEPYISFSSRNAPRITPYFQAWCDRLERRGH